MDDRRRAGRTVPLAVLTAIALVPALALGALWQYADANVPPPTTTTTTTLPPPPAPELDTALLSFRRHPTPLAEGVAAEREEALREAAAEELEQLIPPGSCLVVARDDEPLVEVDPLLPVIPASNQKLLIAAVALDVLGPDHTFVTELVGPPPVDGVVPGSVYLVGGGDPVLRTADVPDPQRYPAFNTTAIEPLVEQLLAAGITRIDGDVVGDGSRYDDEFRVPTWGEGITNYEAGPYDALLINDGMLYDRYGLEPSRSAARVFLDIVLASGIQVTGTSSDGPRPADAVTLASVESAPLTEVLAELLHTSDNNTAEMLVKEIGYVARGEGTRPAGLAVVQERLHRWGVPLEGHVVEDGSGLSRNNRSTCAALHAIVSATPVADQLGELLPVAGQEGTLTDQLVGTPAEGEMVAKTGTLTDVKALTGLQPDAAGDPVAFSVVLNGTDVDGPATYQRVWTEVAEFIASQPIEVEPDVERFAPLGSTEGSS